MKRSELFIKTRKEVPADETSKNAQLLMRAGYVNKEMAGVYSFLPLGKMVADKIIGIVREEMNAIGGQEILMSTLQNKELWELTDRWDDKKVDNWFKTKLLSGTEVGISFSHEEPIANMLKNFVNSYKDLPTYVYQFQTKFRNELRAKSGLLRGREFLMKDLYSFSKNQQEHDEFYEKAIAAYFKVYERVGLGDITYKTYASGGYFSGGFSHEFQTISDIGEDTIYLDESKRIAVNKEIYTDETLAKIGLDKSALVERRAVEVGNIFTLSDRYSEPLGLFFTDEKGISQAVFMGSYGLGISRLIGLLAEHFADDKGLAWPASVAPFEVYLIRLGEEQEVVQAAEDVYKQLTSTGVSVLYDDRGVRAGEMFADADLMGLPHRLVVSKNSLQAGGFELKSRTQDEKLTLTKDSLIEKIVKET
jgi:prolyl-tRNA synthetase